jgi:hypothetical protein
MSLLAMFQRLSLALDVLTTNDLDGKWPKPLRLQSIKSRVTMHGHIMLWH